LSIGNKKLNEPSVLEMLRLRQTEEYQNQQKTYGGFGTQIKGGPVFKGRSKSNTGTGTNRSRKASTTKNNYN